jgi:heme/copper-type cytochrome/quinol oxidase subunit 1
MNAQSLATVLIRVLAIYWFVEAMIIWGDAAVQHWAVLSASGSGWTHYPPLSYAASDLFLHDTYYVFRAPTGSAAIRFALGLVLIISSGWIGRAIAPAAQPHET